MIDVAVRWVQPSPAELCETLTRNRGLEMAHSEVLTNGWGPPIYLLDPHAPSQRPKNGNSCGQMRSWFLKGTDLCSNSQAVSDQA